MPPTCVVTGDNSGTRKQEAGVVFVSGGDRETDPVVAFDLCVLPILSWSCVYHSIAPAGSWRRVSSRAFVLRGGTVVNRVARAFLGNGIMLS